MMADHFPDYLMTTLDRVVQSRGNKTQGSHQSGILTCSHADIVLDVDVSPSPHGAG